MKLEATLEMDKSGLGWTIVASACPAKPLLLKLGKPAWSCRAGLISAGQGAVPIARCTHLDGEVESDKDGNPCVECLFENHDSKKGKDAEDA